MNEEQSQMNVANRRMVSPLSAMSAVFGVAAIVAFFSSLSIVIKILVPLFAVLIGFFALSQIAREDERYSGLHLAKLGMVTGLVMLAIYGVLKLLLMQAD
jgi:uncharacterized membrane protein